MWIDLGTTYVCFEPDVVGRETRLAHCAPIDKTRKYQLDPDVYCRYRIHQIARGIAGFDIAPQHERDFEFDGHRTSGRNRHNFNDRRGRAGINHSTARTQQASNQRPLGARLSHRGRAAYAELPTRHRVACHRDECVLDVITLR